MSLLSPSEAEQLAMIERQDTRYEDRISRRAKVDVYDKMTPSKIKNRELNETNITTCFDFIMQEELGVQDILRDNLIVFVDERGNPFCISIEDFEKQISDSSNWAQECVNGEPKGPIYVKTIISAGAGTGYIPLQYAKSALKMGKKIIHISKKGTFNKSWGYNAFNGGSWVSAYHCQDGSNIDIYHYTKCVGPNCKKIKGIVDTIEAREEELTEEQMIEEMRSFVRQREMNEEEESEFYEYLHGNLRFRDLNPFVKENFGKVIMTKDEDGILRFDRTFHPEVGISSTNKHKIFEEVMKKLTRDERNKLLNNIKYISFGGEEYKSLWDNIKSYNDDLEENEMMDIPRMQRILNLIDEPQPRRTRTARRRRRR